MRQHRHLRLRAWIPALLLCVALAVGLAPSSEEQGTSISLQTAGNDTHVAQPAAPVLLGRAVADDARQPKASPVLGDETDGGLGQDLAAPTEGASRQDEPDDAHMRDGAPLTASHPLVAPVIAIQERYTGELMEHPLVVGTATGMNEKGKIAVVVLAKAPIADLPSSLGGVPVMVYVTGELFASKGKPPGKGGGGGGGKKSPPVDRTARFVRPVPIGVSTGHTAITAGTIGCRVTDGAKVWALSNNHVYANENDAAISDPVIQPGTFDGGTTPDDDIGTLDKFVTLVFDTVQGGGQNVMDAALAISSAGDLDRSTPSDGYGLPKSATVSPAINLRVRKYGRTTGQTNGKIFAINASVNVGYSSGVAGFVDQIVITPGSFSAGGDSGSFIVVQKGADARKGVGLLFAGSSSSTIASPIGPILSEFGVSVDGE